MSFGESVAETEFHQAPRAGVAISLRQLSLALLMLADLYFGRVNFLLLLSLGEGLVAVSAIDVLVPYCVLVDLVG